MIDTNKIEPFDVDILIAQSAMLLEDYLLHSLKSSPSKKASFLLPWTYLRKNWFAWETNMYQQNKELP